MSPPPPRYPDVTAEEWAFVEQRVFLIVQKKAGDNLGPPLDIAREAIRRAQEPTTPAWDREKKTLVRHVGSFANSLMANAFRKLEFTTTRRAEEDEFDRVAATSENPEEALAQAETAARDAAHVAMTRAAVADDACCVALLDAVKRQEKRPSEHALAAGFTYRQIELAREKIGRAAHRIAADEARAARKKGYDK
jgi:hypothetical protein